MATRSKLMYILTLFMFTGLLLTFIYVQVLADDVKTSGNKVQENIQINEDKETKVTVYTYDGEEYTAQGDMDLIKDDGQLKDIIMKLDGTIKKSSKKLIKDEPKKLKDMNSVSLHVENEKDYYSFHSTHVVSVKETKNINEVEIFGYLEGYTNGDNEYSS